MKYVLVTGGVVSGLGKGVTASSIGVVLKACGLRVTSIKIGACLVPPFHDYGPKNAFSLGFGEGSGSFLSNEGTVRGSRVSGGWIVQ
ncbi:CTP synthase [Musa troglodytarum]|uniref:CTP synthase n=1 Tax=Musa troglodytarum TaxID=320322 RepID=A0A9E7EC30_9LILI|nr:CTP synthase [Musa troglodytarum]